MIVRLQPRSSFFFNDTATTEIYTLSLHDALPICPDSRVGPVSPPRPGRDRRAASVRGGAARRSGREGGRPRRAAADGDADPPLARAHVVRRPRRDRAARAPAGAGDEIGRAHV